MSHLLLFFPSSYSLLSFFLTPDTGVRPVPRSRSHIRGYVRCVRKCCCTSPRILGSTFEAILPLELNWYIVKTRWCLEHGSALVAHTQLLFWSLLLLGLVYLFIFVFSLSLCEVTFLLLIAYSLPIPRDHLTLKMVEKRNGIKECLGIGMYL